MSAIGNTAKSAPRLEIARIAKAILRVLDVEIATIESAARLSSESEAAAGYADAPSKAPKSTAEPSAIIEMSNQVCESETRARSCRARAMARDLDLVIDDSHAVGGRNSSQRSLSLI